MNFPKIQLDNFSCYLCNRNAATYLSNLNDTRFGIKSENKIIKCRSCGLMQTYPNYTNEKLKSLYIKHYNYTSKENEIYSHIRAKFFGSFLYKIWLLIDGDVSFHSQKGCKKLLDVGCNEGRGLRIFKRNGFKAEGIEINEIAAKNAKSKGHKVSTATLDEFGPSNQFDVIVLSNVLEHSQDPKNMLANVHRLLKPKGEAWISCPNVESWQRRLFKRFWINWHVPFHIFHFSYKTLSRILNENGFKVKRKMHRSPSIWTSQSIIVRLFYQLEKQNNYLRKAFLISFLMIFIRLIFFPFIFIGNVLGKGDCLVVIADKE